MHLHLAVAHVGLTFAHSCPLGVSPAVFSPWPWLRVLQWLVQTLVYNCCVPQPTVLLPQSVAPDLSKLPQHVNLFIDNVCTM